MASEAEKLEIFMQWLQLNRVELRGCTIKYCNSKKGFGLFNINEASDGVLLVVPLDLAITPMRVLEDPVLGPECQAMFEEGEVDDRFLMILFLMVERLRKSSSWKPYLDMIPRTFGNPLWFTEEEFKELKGTSLYRATELQKKSLQSVFEDKVKALVKRLLVRDIDLEREVTFEDFLWANSVFWTRALNIPVPKSFIFPESHAENGGCSIERVDEKEERDFLNNKSEEPNSNSKQGETVWIEGLVPGIDFCNHDIKAMATWEVDASGSVTGVPLSMYLLSVAENENSAMTGKEIYISYGDKGNEELLYLYGFVIENNPDDYLMVHYPAEALQASPLSDSKMQLIQAQKAELRCLLPKQLLGHGFFPTRTSSEGKSRTDKDTVDDTASHNYSWSGERRTPSYINKLVFPNDFLASLRTIAMLENELIKVTSLLEELVGFEGEREPSDRDVRAAVWEVCGDSGALQLLVDLLNKKMLDLEEGSGTEDDDAKLLKKARVVDCVVDVLQSSARIKDEGMVMISKNTWASIVYRQGQKQLTRLFLREADHALQLSMNDER